MIRASLLVAALLASSAMAATEGTSFSLSSTVLVGYGAGAKWTAKALGPGQYVCGNALFGDPNYGVVKSCVGYPINQHVCDINQGANADASYTTSGAWRSQWCPSPDGLALHILAGKWGDAPTGVLCYLGATIDGKRVTGSGLEKLAKCAPGDVTSPTLLPTWQGDALRIFKTRAN